MKKQNLLLSLVFPLVISCATSPQTAQQTAKSARRLPAQQKASLAEDSDAIGKFDLQTRTLNWAQTQDMVGVYSNAEASPVVPFLNLAKHSIDIEIYEIDDPAVRAALKTALASGVQIRVIKEPKPIAEECDVFATGAPAHRTKSFSAAQISDCTDQRNLVAAIRAKGQYVPFNKDQLCGQAAGQGSCYQHGKMIVIDNKLALVSTGNFNASNLCDLAANPSVCNRDYSYITRDPEAIAGLEQIFENDLKGQRYDLQSILNQGTLPYKLTASPYSKDPLVDFLQSATQSIQLQNQYIRRDSGLSDVLIERAKSGVHIEVQLADICNFNSVPESQAEPDTDMFNAMEAAGITVRMFDKKHQVQGKDGYLHAKVIVVDGKAAWLGSVNGSSESLEKNREFGIFFNQPQRVSALSRYMKTDMDDPTSQKWQDSLACREVGYQSSTTSRPPTPATTPAPKGKPAKPPRKKNPPSE